MLLKRISDYLEQGSQGDLAARVARLEGGGDDVARLRELERVITDNGIVELRAPLEALIERGGAPLRGRRVRSSQGRQVLVAERVAGHRLVSSCGADSLGAEYASGRSARPSRSL